MTASSDPDGADSDFPASAVFQETPPPWLLAMAPPSELLNEYSKMPKTAADFQRAADDWLNDQVDFDRDMGYGGPYDDDDDVYDQTPSGYDPKTDLLELMVYSWRVRSLPAEAAVTGIEQWLEKKAKGLADASAKADPREDAGHIAMLDVWWNHIGSLLTGLRANRAAVTAAFRDQQPPPDARASVTSAAAEAAPAWSLRSGGGSPPERLFSSKRERPSETESPDTQEPVRRRGIGDIDDAELMAAIRRAVSGSDPIERSEALVAVSRELGFERMGSSIQARLEEGFRTAARRKIVGTVQGSFSPVTRTIDDYYLDELVSFLAAATREAFGASWCERKDAIRAAAAYLGFQRTGARIELAFKSAINAAIRRGLLEREGQQIRRAK
jgi:hypothetical protein